MFVACWDLINLLILSLLMSHRNSRDENLRRITGLNTHPRTSIQTVTGLIRIPDSESERTTIM